jgi:hypothetical protein
MWRWSFRSTPRGRQGRRPDDSQTVRRLDSTPPATRWKRCVAGHPCGPRGRQARQENRWEAALAKARPASEVFGRVDVVPAAHQRPWRLGAVDPTVADEVPRPAITGSRQSLEESPGARLVECQKRLRPSGHLGHHRPALGGSLAGQPAHDLPLEPREVARCEEPGRPGSPAKGGHHPGQRPRHPRGVGDGAQLRSFDFTPQKIDAGGHLFQGRGQLVDQELPFPAQQCLGSAEAPTLSAGQDAGVDRARRKLPRAPAQLPGRRGRWTPARRSRRQGSLTGLCTVMRRSPMSVSSPRTSTTTALMSFKPLASAVLSRKNPKPGPALLG